MPQLFWLTCYCIALLTSTPTNNFSTEEGLVAYYSFNHCDARDDSGNQSDGVLHGGVGCWCGVEDDGLLFDGDQDYIEFTGIVNQYFTTSDFTLSFYVKPEQYTVFAQSLFSKSADCSDDPFHAMDFFLTTSDRSISPQLYESTYKYYPNLDTYIGKTNWIQFTLVRAGNRAYTYLNGELMQEGFRCSGVDLSNDALLSFSNAPCVNSGKARRFRGVLDEVRVYDYALSPQQVRMLYRLHPVDNASMDCAT